MLTVWRTGIGAVQYCGMIVDRYESLEAPVIETDAFASVVSYFLPSVLMQARLLFVGKRTHG